MRPLFSPTPAEWLGHEGGGIHKAIQGDAMSGGSTRSMTFQAKPPEVFSALQEAARRTGFQYLSGDVSTGTAMFTSGRFLLGFGEKVTARMEAGSARDRSGDAVLGSEVRGRRLVGPARSGCRPSVRGVERASSARRIGDGSSNVSIAEN